ncbi:Uridine kinase [Tulasnella sp. JGI-2019a]|nr:Uridine kinase [Tulasnella sp. JGI-2019a]
MLARRIKRDTTERGRDVEGILDQYLRFVKPSYDNFVQPSSKYADIIVPGHDNSMAIEIISTHVKRMLKERAVRFRERLARSESLISRALETGGGDTFEGTTVLSETPQLKGIYTIMRNQETDRAEFIFQADRLATLVMEKAMEYLPFKPHPVETPIGVISTGKTLAANDVCGVSIIRSGGPLEKGLRRTIRDVTLGALLIQTDPESGEALLLHTSLPLCIRERERSCDTWVFLLDAQISTGAAAFMVGPISTVYYCSDAHPYFVQAIRVLLDHGIKEEHIIFATFLVAKTGGIRTIRHAFPAVRFVIGAVDDTLTAVETEGRTFWNLSPGMGHIGDRYFTA